MTEHGPDTNEGRPQASVRLKALRKAAGQSVAGMALLLDRRTSTYAHYENRLKKAFLPPDLIADIQRALAQTAARNPEVRRLLDEVVTHNAPGAFAEGSGDYSTTPGKVPPNPRQAVLLPEGGPEVILQTDGKKLHLSANVDRAGLERLIARLTRMLEILE